MSSRVAANTSSSCEQTTDDPAAGRHLHFGHRKGVGAGQMTQQEIPEGTVTVLFTDLLNPPRLNQALGDDAARQIGRQVEEMARAAVASLQSRRPHQGDGRRTDGHVRLRSPSDRCGP